MKQKKCFAILLLCALTAFHILWDRQFSSTDSSDFVPVLPEPVIQINAMEQTPNPLILHASYACLMDAGSHRILYSKNTDKKVPMASTTKIMTALLALESNKLNDVVIASKKAAAAPRNHGFCPPPARSRRSAGTGQKRGCCGAAPFRRPGQS